MYAILSGALVLALGTAIAFAAGANEKLLVKSADGTNTYSLDGGRTWSEDLPEGYNFDEALQDGNGFMFRGDKGSQRIVIRGGPDMENLPEGACGDKYFRLTLKEGQLLELLLKHGKVILPTSTIIEKLWGFETETEDSHVQVYVSFLRKKLTQLSSVVKIKAVRGVGYILAAAEDGVKDV